MTAQVKALAAPQLKEAENGVLHVHKLEGHATVLVDTYTNQTVGDIVKIQITTSTGNSFGEQKVVTAAQVGKPLTFAIPKDVFEKNLVQDATAKLHYVVTAVAHQPAESAPLTVHLER
nr:hypothetical protein [uncultured Pseudomonas sp.]